MKKSLITLAMTGLLASTAHAAVPTATISTPGISFAEYAGSTVVGEGLINSPTLYYISERSGPLGNSWYVFFEPTNAKSIDATITFDSAVTGVFSARNALDSSNATYGASNIHYGTSRLLGLEGNDTATFSGNTLTIHWLSNNPGDHIRVFTSAVPEPSSYALLAVGLVAVGFAARGRRSRD